MDSGYELPPLMSSLHLFAALSFLKHLYVDQRQVHALMRISLITVLSSIFNNLCDFPIALSNGF